MATALASPRPKTAETMATPGVQEQTRLYFADHLRVALTALVVLHHLAITYGIAIGWYYQEVSADELVNLISLFFILFNQAYFMSLFFCLAAYFTPGAYDRKGGTAFLRDRGLRLGVPFLLFAFLIGPIAALGLYYSYMRGTIPYWRYYFSSTGASVAWFIVTLLLFSLGYALWRRVTGSHTVWQVTTARPPSALAIIGFILALAVVSYLVRIPFPAGWWVPWINLQLGYYPQYIAMFIVGLIAYRRNWFQTIPAKAGVAGLIAAILTTIICLPLALSAEQAAFGGGS